MQAFAIRYFCQKERGALESKIDQWYENEKTATRSAKIISLSRTALKRIAAVAACVAAVVVGLWQLRINSVLIPNTPEALQSSASVLVAQTTDAHIPNIQDHKPATITDNEIKNTIVQSADRHDEPILTAEQNIITDVPTQKNETANLLQKHNAIAENIDTPKPKIYCSNGCSDEYIMGVFDECVLA